MTTEQKDDAAWLFDQMLKISASGVSFSEDEKDRFLSIIAKLKAEPSATKKRAEKAAKIERPEYVSEEVWADFVQLRNKHKAPITQTAINRIEREAYSAGLTLQGALEICCARGWRSFEAGWVLHNKTQATAAAASFYEKDQQAKRKNWEEQTGRKWPAQQEFKPLHQFDLLDINDGEISDAAY